MREGEHDVDTGWYRRFRLPQGQAEAVRETVTRIRGILDDGREVAETLDRFLELAWALTPLGEEREAARCGQRAIDLARSQGSVALEIEALLHTATALQYSGEQAHAERMFEDGLKLCRRSGHDEQLHYLLHHLGRLKAEQLDEAGAGATFEAAMIERQRRGLVDLAESSGTALAGLRTWIESRQGRSGVSDVREPDGPGPSAEGD